MKKNVRVKNIIIITIFMTLLLLFTDYMDYKFINFNSLNEKFWASYFSIVVAILLPLYLFSKEVEDRNESEEKLKKDIEEKDEKNIFISGISRVKPNVTFDYDYVDNKLTLTNIGIGNATDIAIFWYEVDSREYKLAYTKKINRRYSNITLRPNEEKIIDDFTLDVENTILVETKNFNKILIIYTNLLCSEIYFSKIQRNENDGIRQSYYSSYNFQPDEYYDSIEMSNIIQRYIGDKMLKKFIYKYDEFSKKLEENIEN